MTDPQYSTGTETLYRRIELGDGHVSYEPVRDAAQQPLDPCPYAEDGMECLLETHSVGPCLCVNPVAAAPQPSGNAYGAWQPIETAPKDQEVEVRGIWKLKGDGVVFTHWRPTSQLPSTPRATPRQPLNAIQFIALLEILEECAEHVTPELEARIKNVLGYHTDHDTVSSLPSTLRATPEGK